MGILRHRAPSIGGRALAPLCGALPGPSGRFSELRGLSGASPNVLSQRLSEPEAGVCCS